MKYFIFIFFSFFFYFSSLGQNDSTQNKAYYWFSYGWNCYSKYNLFGERFALNSSYKQKYFLIILYHRYINFNLVFFEKPKPNKMLKIDSKSILFGYGKYYYKHFSIIPSTGISFGDGLYRGALIDSTPNYGWLISHTSYNFEMDDFKYIGIPINIKILWTTPYVGVSLDLFANIHKYSDFGFIFSINLGKIMDRKRK